MTAGIRLHKAQAVSATRAVNRGRLLCTTTTSGAEATNAAESTTHGSHSAVSYGRAGTVRYVAIVRTRAGTNRRSTGPGTLPAVCNLTYWRARRVVPSQPARVPGTIEGHACTGGGTSDRWLFPRSGRSPGRPWRTGTGAGR